MTASLTGNRADERWEFRTLPFANLGMMPGETGELDNVTGGSVELSYLSDLKASCTFDYEGGDSPDPNLLVRIYHAFEDDSGETYRDCVGTFLVSYDETDHAGDWAYSDADGLALRGLKVSGSADGYSVLKVLQDRIIGYPLQYPAGTTYAVNTAVGIMEGFGLPVKSESGDTYTLATEHTFDASDTWLSVVNWLCNAAGFRAPYPDAYGTVIVEKAEESRSTTPRWTFDAGADSVMLPTVTVGNDWQTTPNVARLCYENEEESIWATATNADGNKMSVAARGREITVFESVTELSGDTQSDRLANLKAMAGTKLLANSQEIEHTTVGHPYIGLRPNDAVRIDYGGTVWEGNVLNVSIELEPGAACETEIRRYIPNEINPTTDGGAS